MFDPNVGLGDVDASAIEDTRLLGYDPMIPPALIQEEIPSVSLHKFSFLAAKYIFVFFRVEFDMLVPRINENSSHYPSSNPRHSFRKR